MIKPPYYHLLGEIFNASTLTSHKFVCIPKKTKFKNAYMVCKSKRIFQNKQNNEKKVSGSCFLKTQNLESSRDFDQDQFKTDLIC